MGKRKLIIIVVPVVVALIVAGVIAGVIILAASAPAATHQTPENFAATSDNSTAPVESCDFNSLIGQSVKVIDRSTFGNRVVRIMHPDDPVTMDYAPSRINILLDKHNVITEVKCG
jgi:hypothetical protein